MSSRAPALMSYRAPALMSYGAPALGLALQRCCCGGEACVRRTRGWRRGHAPPRKTQPSARRVPASQPEQIMMEAPSTPAHSTSSPHDQQHCRCSTLTPTRMLPARTAPRRPEQSPCWNVGSLTLPADGWRQRHLLARAQCRSDQCGRGSRQASGPSDNTESQLLLWQQL